MSKCDIKAGDYIRVHDTSGIMYPERLIGKTFKVKSVHGNGLSDGSIIYIDVYSPYTPGNVLNYGIRRDRVYLITPIVTKKESYMTSGITKQRKNAPWDKVKPTFIGKWFIQGVVGLTSVLPVNTEINIEYSGKTNPRYKFNLGDDVYLVTWDWMKEARDTNALTRGPVDYAKIEVEKAAAEQAERVAKNLGVWEDSYGDIRVLVASGHAGFPYRYTTEPGHTIDYSEECIEDMVQEGHLKRPYSVHGPVPVDHVDHMVTLTQSGDTSELVLGVVYVTHDTGCNKDFHVIRTGTNKHLLYVDRCQGWVDYYTTNISRGRNLSPVYEWPIIPQALVESSGLADIWAAVPAEVVEDKQ